MGAGMATGRPSRWTRYFTVASAASLVVSQAVAVLGGTRSVVVTIAVFGFVCPMIFGMAYLLLPSFVGRTLIDQRLPAVHSALAYVGASALVAGRTLDRIALTRDGVALWSLGVAVFVGALARTVVPAILNRPEIILRSDEAPQRSTRLATAVIAVAIGYLVVGTGALLGWAGLGIVPTFTFPAVVHYYAAGLGALLIFALGARLVPGFFHVTPPRAPSPESRRNSVPIESGYQRGPQGKTGAPRCSHQSLPERDSLELRRGRRRRRDRDGRLSSSLRRTSKRKTAG